MELGIKNLFNRWPMWKWQVFQKWNFLHGCNFPCLGGCALSTLGFDETLIQWREQCNHGPFYQSFNGCERWHVLMEFFWTLVEFLSFFPSPNCWRTLFGLPLWCVFYIDLFSLASLFAFEGWNGESPKWILVDILPEHKVHVIWGQETWLCWFHVSLISDEKIMGSSSTTPYFPKNEFSISSMLPMMW